MAADAKCDRRLQSRRVVTLDAVENVPHANETAMMQAKPFDYNNDQQCPTLIVLPENQLIYCGGPN